jgi:hypothetical protein
MTSPTLDPMLFTLDVDSIQSPTPQTNVQIEEKPKSDPSQKNDPKRKDTKQKKENGQG